MSQTTSGRTVFAAVPYANAAPLVHFLDGVADGIEVLYGEPSGLAAHLMDGTADAAILPVAAFFETPGLRRIDGLGICASGQVESVLLKCSRPVEQVRRVACDPASRTSNALASILLAEHFHVPAEVRLFGPDEPVDACVMIGDRALCEPPAACGDYDLAAVWKEMTSLPFVFAVWAYREDHAEPDRLARIAHAAHAAGVKALEQLVEIMAADLSLPPDRCRRYLTRSVYHDVGEREVEAMERFREMLAARRDAPGTGGPGGEAR